MQILNAAPRQNYTVAQVLALIQAPDLTMAPGMELLDQYDNFVADITSSLGNDTAVMRDCKADIHGTVTFTLTQELQWGYDRVRPYVVCSSVIAGVSGARFDLGIYVVTSPSHNLGEKDALGATVNTFSVTGYDKLYFMDQPVGDSVICGAGSVVLTQVTNMINTATNNDPKIALDGTASAAILAADKAWPISSAGGSPATYLSIANDLLRAINYIPLWVDQDGYFRSSPFQDPSTASPEYTFNVQDMQRNIVADPRTVTRDTWGVPNWFRFIQNGLSAQPAEGAGQFTYIDTSTPLTGYQDRGYYVRRVYSVDAVDQQTLQNLAAQQIDIDTSTPETFTVPSGPMPQSGHFDVVVYIDTAIDGGVTFRKCQVQSWTLRLDGSEMDRTMTTALVAYS